MGFIIRSSENDKLVSLQDEDGFIYILVGDDIIAQIDKDEAAFELVGYASKANTGLDVDDEGYVITFRDGVPLNGPRVKRTKK
jgi:hypothetical protein